MTRIDVDLGSRSYPVFVGAQMLDRIGPWLAEYVHPSKVALLSHSRVLRLHGAPLLTGLRQAGLIAEPITVPAGERHKTMRTVARLWSRMLHAGLDRRSVVIVLGGGVLGDTGGFAAATFMRGVRVVQAPTTLLAQVDASIGGKVGVDLPEGKNLVGAFHQPSAVFADVHTLRTLPRRELRAGLAEVVKYGIICDEPFFRLVRSRSASLTSGDLAVLEPAVARCCAIKAEVVAEDEREGGRRAILNFGHTLGHAVEALTGFSRYLHGEAVAIGMAAACAIGEVIGATRPDVTQQVRGALADLGLSDRWPEDLSPHDVLSSVQRDKKAVGGRPRFVLARDLGDVAVMDVSDEAVLAALGRLSSEGR